MVSEIESIIDDCIDDNGFNKIKFNSYLPVIKDRIKRNNKCIFEDLGLTGILKKLVDDDNTDELEEYINKKLVNNDEPELDTPEGNFNEVPEIGVTIKVYNPNRYIWEIAKCIGYDQDNDLYLFKSLSLAGMFTIAGKDLLWKKVKRYPEMNLVSRQVTIKNI